jgi:hypothetical protein
VKGPRVPNIRTPEWQYSEAQVNQQEQQQWKWGFHGIQLCKICMFSYNIPFPNKKF